MSLVMDSLKNLLLSPLRGFIHKDFHDIFERMTLLSKLLFLVNFHLVNYSALILDCRNVLLHQKNLDFTFWTNGKTASDDKFALLLVLFAIIFFKKYKDQSWEKKDYPLIFFILYTLNMKHMCDFQIARSGSFLHFPLESSFIRYQLNRYYIQLI